MPDHKRNLFVLSFTIFLAACSWNQVVPFLPLYIETMNVNGSVARWAGIIFAMHFVSAFIAQPLWGKLGDRVGRKLMIIRAGLGLTLVYFGLSLSTSPLQLAAWRFVNGALTGFIPGSIALIATNTPDRLAAKYVAFGQSAAAAGAIVGPTIGGLLAGIFGFRGSLRVSGVVLLLSTIAVWLLVQEKTTGRQTEHTTLKQDLQAVFQSRVLQAVMATVMIATGVGQSVMPILTLYLREMSPETSDVITGSIFSLPGLAFVLMASRWSAFGERRGFDKSITLGIIGGGTAMIALGFVHSIGVFGLGYFIYGIFAAALMPSAGALIATKVPEDFRGRAYGAQQSASMLGGLISPLAGGWLGEYFGLRSIFLAAGLTALAGAVFLHRRIFQAKVFRPAAQSGIRMRA